MRRFNSILAVLIIILFLTHGIMGSFQLFGVGDTAIKFIARTAEGLIYIHMVIGIKYSIDTILAEKKSGVKYRKENKLFWLRRISGFAILIFLIFHFEAFNTGGEVPRLPFFDTFKLITQLLLVISVAIHIISNIRPIMISFGVERTRSIYVDVLLVLSVILVIMGLAFVIYYLRWNFW